MASNELEVLDPAATVEKLTKLASGRALNRRHFMTALGMTGAAAMSGCSSSTSTPVTTSSGPAQTDVLNFALNLEYLEATFYSYLVRGADLPSSYTVPSNINPPVSPAPPAIGSQAVTYYPTAGSVTPTSPPAQLTTANAPQTIIDMLSEIYYDELNHVVALQGLLGPLAVVRPQLNFSSVTATNFLGVARLLEDVGVTAYAGAAAFLSNSNLTFASQILGVESFHAGAVRLASIQTGATYVPSGDSYDVMPADPGTAALAAAGPSTNGAGVTSGFFGTAYATATGPGTSLTSPSVPPGFAFARTTSQVLSIVYAGGSSSFFPKGLNGVIK